MKLNRIIVLVFAICISCLLSGQKTGKVSDKLITITGKVLDKNQIPVSGAVLYIDNIKTNIVTRKNGYYKIKVSPSAIALEVRSSIYGNCVTPINGQININFTLNAVDTKASSAEDHAKNDVAGDNHKKTTKVKSKKINTYNDIYQMIRAEVNGVVVNGRSVQIQQGHSFFGSSTPLFLINGVIVNSIDDVNPLEVKSIRVLKGSEAAIYGVQGSNGVLSITLKNGTEKE
jgi:hypothetical protein